MLETLEELVFDENKVVTFKSFSHDLGIHVNEAKKWLYEFSLMERKRNHDLTITYFLSGLSSAPDASQIITNKVIHEDVLEDEKAALNSVISCHIYSVQASALKDCSPLYITNYNAFADGVYNYNAHGCISHPTLVLRPESYVKPREPSKDSTTEFQESLPGAQIKHSTTNSKKGAPSIMETLFSKKTAKTIDSTERVVKNRLESKDNVKPSMKLQAPLKGKVCAVTSNKNGMMDKSPKADISPKANISPTKAVTQSNKLCPIGKEERLEPSHSEASEKRQKKHEQSNSNKVTRRRIKNPVESSSDEEMDSMPESPLGSRPDKPSPCIEDSQPGSEEPLVQSTTVTSANSTSSEVPITSYREKKRKRIKKLVPKTFVDDDGYMVTEKVWQTESSEASDSEEPLPKRLLSEEPIPKNHPPVKDHDTLGLKGKKPTTTKAVSPTKSGPKLQKSITSFFAKK